MYSRRMKNDWRSSREFLGVSADVLAVGGAIGVVGPFVVGFIAGQLAPALASALVVSLLVILYLLSRLRKANRLLALRQRNAAADRSRLRLAIVSYSQLLEGLGRSNTQLRDVQSVAAGALAGQDRTELDAAEDDIPAPSAWLPNREDLTSFAMTTSDFEALLQDAQSRATAELGPDVRVRMADVTLYARLLSAATDTPHVHFVGWSRVAKRAIHIYYLGDINRVESFVRPETRHAEKRSPAVKQWATNPEYLELVRQSWRRMGGKPNGVVTLEAFEDPYPGTQSRWLAIYVVEPGTGPSLGNGQYFTLRNGELVEVL